MIICMRSDDGNKEGSYLNSYSFVMRQQLLAWVDGDLVALHNLESYCKSIASESVFKCVLDSIALRIRNLRQKSTAQQQEVKILNFGTTQEFTLQFRDTIAPLINPNANNNYLTSSNPPKVSNFTFVNENGCDPVKIKTTRAKRKISNASQSVSKNTKRRVSTTTTATTTTTTAPAPSINTKRTAQESGISNQSHFADVDRRPAKRAATATVDTILSSGAVISHSTGVPSAPVAIAVCTEPAAILATIDDPIDILNTPPVLSVQPSITTEDHSNMNSDSLLALLEDIETPIQVERNWDWIEDENNMIDFRLFNTDHVDELDELLGQSSVSSMVPHTSSTSTMPMFSPEPSLLLSPLHPSHTNTNISLWDDVESTSTSTNSASSTTTRSQFPVFSFF